MFVIFLEMPKFEDDLIDKERVNFGVRTMIIDVFDLGDGFGTAL